MNIELRGESSSKRQENGDARKGSERPLKKARFAWQVKGKYHLKNEISDSQNVSEASLQSIRPGSSNETNTNNMGSEQNLEILGDYLLKQDFNTLDSVITDTDKTLLTPSSSVSSEKLQYPRYITSYDNNDTSRVNKSTRKTCDTSFPMSVAISQNYTDDQCIARWQARQIAIGFVDNRINHVLDSWIHAQTDEETSGFLALEVAEFINNLPGANSIENEGILMAISAHGLQNTSSDSNLLMSNCDSNVSLSSKNLQSDEELEQYTDTHKFEDNVSNDLGAPWTNNHKNDEQFSLFPDSSISYQCISENKNTNEEIEHLNENSYELILDEAVLFAIHNKGLTTKVGTDYG